MDFADYVKAYLMNQAAHTQEGHMKTSYDMNMNPVGQNYVDYDTWTERVPRWVNNPQTDQQRRAASLWHGSGFRAQGEMGKKLQGTELGRKYDLIQGLMEAGYLAQIPQALGVPAKGDIEHLTDLHGGFTKFAIGADAVAKILKSMYPDSKWSGEFDQAAGGAPVFKISRDF